MLDKFKVGDEVVPLKKTRGGVSDEVWEMRRNSKTPYLFVAGINRERGCYVLNGGGVKLSGNFYAEDDLIAYEMSSFERMRLALNDL